MPGEFREEQGDRSSEREMGDKVRVNDGTEGIGPWRP